MKEAVPEEKLDAQHQRAFRLARRAARQVVRRRIRVLRLVRDAYVKLSKHENALVQVMDDLLLSLRLIKAWALREYRDVPWRTIIYLLAAVIYFINPVDLIPDAIAGIGFIDDIAVIGAVISSIRKDLDAFQSWENEQAP